MPDWPPRLDLDPTHLARRYDPDTSKATARRIKLRSQALRILRVYAATQREMIDHTAYDLAGFSGGRLTHQRCSDLRALGFIERTGNRAMTPSGNSAHCCRITELGMRFLLKLEPFDRSFT